jgi:hypothetical protein
MGHIPRETGADDAYSYGTIFQQPFGAHHELGKKLERTIRLNKQNVIAAISLIFYMRERLLMRA